MNDKNIKGDILEGTVTFGNGENFKFPSGAKSPDSRYNFLRSYRRREANRGADQETLDAYDKEIEKYRKQAKEERLKRGDSSSSVLSSLAGKIRERLKNTSENIKVNGKPNKAVGSVRG